MEREREEDQDKDDWTLSKGIRAEPPLAKYARDRAGWRGAPNAVARGPMRLDGTR